MQGDNASELDFGAVQRGDAEMEQKMNRVLRGCVESGDNNPICSLHDQGAGGNGEGWRREGSGEGGRQLSRTMGSLNDGSICFTTGAKKVCKIRSGHVVICFTTIMS